MVHQIIGVWLGLLRRLRAGWQRMFFINLAYSALGIVLLAPLTGLIIHLLVRLSGNSVIADQDIAYFLLTPLGIVSLILVAAISLAIAALAQASMMFIGIRTDDRLPTTLNALLFAATHTGHILAFSLRLVVRVLLLMAPFLIIATAVAWLLLTDYDINYYLSNKPPAFWTAGVIIAVLLLVMLVLLVRKLLGWSLALALVLFANASPANSFAQSEQLTQKRRPLVFGVAVSWALVTLIIGALILGILQLLGNWLVPRFYDQLTVLVVVLGGLATLWTVLNFLAVSFNGATFALAIIELGEKLNAPIQSDKALAASTPGAGIGLKITTARVALALSGGVIIAAIVGIWLVDSIDIRDDVAVVAHRGAAGKAPENTLAAVNQAIEDGADWIEIDVQETADGEVVVIHDSDFMKLAGVNLKIWEATLEQLRDIDIGSWFGPEFSSERTPTLREVLETARGKAKVVIELKYYGHDQQLEQRVVDIVEAVEMVADSAIMSLKNEAIQKIRSLRPDWNIGLLSSIAIGDLTKHDVDFLAINSAMATASFVRDANAAGKPVFVWTINDPVSMSRMLSKGIDGVITDEPEMAREVLRQRAEMNPVERLLVHMAVLFGQPLPQRSYRDESP